MKLPHVDALAEKYAARLTISFKRRSRSIVARLLNEASDIDEGTAAQRFIEQARNLKNWDSAYKYGLDRRPPHHGGDQLHIQNRNGERFAYRYDGTRSERTKYSSPATNEVKNIVRTVFNLGPDAKIEATVMSASNQEILIEVLF